MSQFAFVPWRELRALRWKLAFWRTAAQLLGALLLIVALVFAVGGANGRM